MPRPHRADMVYVSTIGRAVDASALQAAQVQQLASKARDRERAAAEGAQRLQDVLDLRVAGAESAEAVRSVADDDEAKQRGKKRPKRSPKSKPEEPEQEQPPHVDLKA